MSESAPGAASEAAAGNRSVTRALDMLELLARSERALSLADVAKQLELPKSSVLSLLRALTARDFAAVDQEGRYALGLRSFEVGVAYLRKMTPVRAAEAELRRLTESLDVTSHFAVLQDDEVVYLAKHDPRHSPIRLASSLGARLPAASTAVGMVQLAHEDGAAELDPELSSVRAAGYAVDSGTTAHGIQCVAAPVFSSSGCCGAIGVSYLHHGGPPMDDVIREVTEAAQRASASLGRRSGGPSW